MVSAPNAEAISTSKSVARSKAAITSQRRRASKENTPDGGSKCRAYRLKMSVRKKEEHLSFT